MANSRVKRAFVAAAALAAAPLSSANLTTYSQGFETLVQTDTGALAADGWLVFYNVYAGGDGTFLFGFGPFPAPNDGAAFCSIETDQGGLDQGTQQLSVFNDYNNGSHPAGDLVEASVFRQQSIGVSDAGSSWIFRFDAKRGDIDGATTALAFIRTFDPAKGFVQTNFITLDMTDVSPTWSSSELTIAIDNGLVGQLLHIGFASTATNFENSGIFYDNVSLRTPIDSDNDGVENFFDNCRLVANPDQRDTDSDGHGNICDADLNNDGIVNAIDLGIFRSRFFSTDPDADFNGDGQVNSQDLGILRARFFMPPGD